MTGKLYLRGKIWWMRYTQRGREFRESCETTSREQAQGKLDLTLARLRLTGVVSPRDVRLEDLVNDAFTEYRSAGKLGVLKTAECCWRLHLKPFFGRVRIVDLGTADFTQYRVERLAAGAAQATINRELQVVIHAYKIGYRATPPKVERMPYIKLAKEDNARRSFISDEQREKLFVAASMVGLWARVLLEMAYLLGWRLSELLQLRVGNINLVDRTVRLETTKNGEGRECPMTERLALLLQQLVTGRDRSEWLFPVHHNGTWKYVWDRIRKDAGCPNVLFHDWRRTSARAKRAAGVPEGVIMELQGWKTAAMFRRYAIVNQDDKRRALELVDARGNA